MSTRASPVPRARNLRQMCPEMGAPGLSCIPGDDRCPNNSDGHSRIFRRRFRLELESKSRAGSGKLEK